MAIRKDNKFSIKHVKNTTNERLREDHIYHRKMQLVIIIPERLLVDNKPNLIKTKETHDQFRKHNLQFCDN